MRRTDDKGIRSQRGFSLAEVLTATAIFAVIFVAALLLYDRSNRVYKEGVQASDMQQTTRVAFDKLVGDLRMTGFDFDRDGTPQSALASAWQPNAPYSIGNIVEPNPPNGHTYRCTQGGNSHPTTPPAWNTASASQTNENAPSTVIWQEVDELQYQQPDEQVEYAGASVIGIRSNYDFDFETGPCIVPNTPCENGREPAYESTTFPVVTTGNDEMVIYALRPMNPPVGFNPPQLSFFADAGKPRRVNQSTNTKEDQINLPRVYDPCTGGCNNPPYTLYRITLQDRNGVAFTETPLADNIRSVNYRYFRDAAATDEITTLPDGAGQYDPAASGATIVGRDTRAEIRAIRINLIGMNQQADPNFNDPTDAVAPTYRKYQLESLIVPRNIGRRGMKEFTTDAPDAPVLDVVCPGSCNAVYVAWSAAATGGEVESYNILYDTDDCTTGFTYAEDAGRNLDGYAATIPWITPGKTYFFAVQAINKFGNATSNCISAMVQNTTRPKPPAKLEATGTTNPALPPQANQITIQWPPATDNYTATSTLTCSNGSTRSATTMPTAERRYYRLYKSKDDDVDPADSDTILLLDENSPSQPTFDGTNMVFVDTLTANCTPYYYRIATVDYCARNAAYNQGNNASLGVSTDYFPAMGTDGIEGEARVALGAARPAQPTAFAIANRTCTGPVCDLTFAWNAVTKNDGAPTGPNIYIDRYRIRVEEKVPATGVWIPATTALNTSYNFSNGALTGVIKDVPLTTEYRFFLSARDCNDGVESVPVYFPCTFAGGTVTISSPVSYGGTGTSADPWITDTNASVRVQTSNAIKQVTATVYQNNLPISSFDSGAGSFTDVNIPMPDVTDGVLARVSIVISDLSGTGCQVFFERFILDQPAPTCALDNDQTNPSVIVFSQATDSVNFILKNDSTQALKIISMTVTWTPGSGNNQAEELLSASFTTGTTTVNCLKASTVITPPTGTSIAASTSSSGSLLFRRAKKGQPINTNPVSRVCVRYQVPAGDVLDCSIFPGPGTCSAPPASPCQ